MARRLSFGSRLDEAGLQPAEKRSVLGQRLGELRRDSTLGGCAVGEGPEAVGRPGGELIAFVHCRTGGSSPVATRYARAASLRAPTTARADIAIQSSLRSTEGNLPR